MLRENRRLLLIAAIMGILSILLILRLFYIQLIEGPLYAEKALKQKTSSSSKKVRGEILDRNYMSLCDSKTITYANISPHWLSVSDKQLLIDMGLLNNLDDSSLKNIKVPREHVGKLKNLAKKTPGIYLYEDKTRYGEAALATHVIGYYGKTGIEKTFNSFLESNTKENYIVSDGLGQTIGGISHPKADTVLQKVVLTIDKTKQQIVEEIMDEKIESGAVIVLDAKNGEVLAMASRPNYKQYNLEHYLTSENAPLINRAVEIYPPGSIFKIVVLSAAIEEKITNLNEHYMCSGFEKVGGNVFTCPSYKNGGHGEITLQDAMAYSCNSVFIQLGIELGKDKLMEYAKAYGFGEKIDIGISEEKEGNLPIPEEVFYQDLGNLSIGQGPIGVTPLQVAQMLLTITNKGIIKKPVLVKELIDDRGTKHNADREQCNRRVVSERTAEKIKQSLIAATRYGTGTLSTPHSEYDSAGKTGTAEVSANQYHAWFAGFYPAQDPQYVICVLVENGGSGSTTAAPIFRDILQKFESFIHDSGIESLSGEKDDGTSEGFLH